MRIELDGAQIEWSTSSCGLVYAEDFTNNLAKFFGVLWIHTKNFTIALFLCLYFYTATIKLLHLQNYLSYAFQSVRLIQVYRLLYWSAVTKPALN